MQGTLTPAGVCCASGEVDECGMCDGLHNCATEGTLTVRSQAAGGAAAASRRRLAGTDAAEEQLLQGYRADVCLALGRYPDHCDGVTVDLVSDDGTFTVVRARAWLQVLHAAWIFSACQ